MGMRCFPTRIQNWNFGSIFYVGMIFFPNLFWKPEFGRLSWGWLLWKAIMIFQNFRWVKGHELTSNLNASRDIWYEGTRCPWEISYVQHAELSTNKHGIRFHDIPTQGHADFELPTFVTYLDPNSEIATTWRCFTFGQGICFHELRGVYTNELVSMEHTINCCLLNVIIFLEFSWYIYIYVYIKIYIYIYISHPKIKFPKKHKCFSTCKNWTFQSPPKNHSTTRSTSSAVVAWRKATAKRSQRSKVPEVIAPPTVGPRKPPEFFQQTKCWSCLTYDWTKNIMGGWTNPLLKKNIIVKMGSSSPIFGLKMKKTLKLPARTNTLSLFTAKTWYSKLFFKFSK